MAENVQTQRVCPDCGLAISVLPETSGQAVECPKCGSKVSPRPSPVEVSSAGEAATVEASGAGEAMTVEASSTAPGPTATSEQPRPKSSRSTKDIDWTQARLDPPRQKLAMIWLAAVGLGSLVLVFGLLLSFRVHRGGAKVSGSPENDGSSLAPSSPTPTPQEAAPSQRGISNFPTPPAWLPPARVKRPKSLNDFKFGDFVLTPRRSGDGFMAISGDIENVSDNLHRGLRVELDLLDAQGLKIGVINDVMMELAPRATWHLVDRTTNARTASVRLVGIKEDP